MVFSVNYKRNKSEIKSRPDFYPLAMLGWISCLSSRETVVFYIVHFQVGAACIMEISSYRG